MGLVNTPDCAWCLGIRETIAHYLLLCPRHTVHYQELNYLKDSILGITDGSITLSLLSTGSDFSSGIRRKIMMLLLDYFKDTKNLTFCNIIIFLR